MSTTKQKRCKWCGQIKRRGEKHWPKVACHRRTIEEAAMAEEQGRLLNDLGCCDDPNCDGCWPDHIDTNDDSECVE